MIFCQETSFHQNFLHDIALCYKWWKRLFWDFGCDLGHKKENNTLLQSAIFVNYFGFSSFGQRKFIIKQNAFNANLSDQNVLYKSSVKQIINNKVNIFVAPPMVIDELVKCENWRILETIKEMMSQAKNGNRNRFEKPCCWTATTYFNIEEKLQKTKFFCLWLIRSKISCS